MTNEIFYFGTSCTDYGHYLWKAEGGMLTKLLNAGLVPESFDPYNFPEKTHGQNWERGIEHVYHENGFTIYAICGSPKDNRRGTRSVFYTKGELSHEEMIWAVKEIACYADILNKLP